jgi:hypothetical protein
VYGSRIRILLRVSRIRNTVLRRKGLFFYIQEDEEEELEEELEDERLRQQAVAERERGNALFKAGKYDLAVEKYTAGHYYVTHTHPSTEGNELGFFIHRDQ